MSRQLVHIRVEAEHLERLDAVQARLHCRSRAQVFDVGLPFMLAHLEQMADTLESTIERRKETP